MDLVLVESASTNPYENLALESYLLDAGSGEKSIILYFWRNDNTVVIGRNQNPFEECNIQELERNGTLIARRITGGGAVYHDLGNLNFSLILPRAFYDTARSTLVISDALQTLGLQAMPNGRNDICINGRKISGNAYYSNAKVGLHHGTILIKVDTEKIDRFLNVTQLKMDKHGISSVRSRVTDIISHDSTITIQNVKDAVRNQVVKEYHLEDIRTISVEKNNYMGLYETFKSDGWNYRRYRECTVSADKSFAWGMVKINFLVADGIVRDIELSTDALDLGKVGELRNRLLKCLFQQPLWLINSTLDKLNDF